MFMPRYRPSYDRYAIKAEKKMLDDFELRKHNGLKLLRAKPIKVGDKSTIRPDGYSKDTQTVCEVSSRIGTPNPGQIHKVMRDVLKMIFLEKYLDRPLKKWMIFASPEAERPFKGGRTWMASCLNKFGVETFVAKLSKARRKKILKEREEEGVRRGKNQ